MLKRYRGALYRSGGAPVLPEQVGAMSQLDAHEKRYVPELEALKEWIGISLLLLGAVILPVSFAYLLFLLTNW
jgi:hypothetical protein